MTVIEAMENALTFLEALGYRSGGDIHDDLARALDAIKNGHSGYSRLRERKEMLGRDKRQIAQLQSSPEGGCSG